MRLTFVGAAHEVTGSCTLLEVNGYNILIDCGMEQGADIYENTELPIASYNIDAICLTHAHIDHSGMIPAMVARGFSGVIYCTEATERLCGIMLRDSAYIQESEAGWRNRRAQRMGKDKYEPPYTVKDAERSLELFDSFGYNITREIFPGVSISFIDAGHLLGSASIYFTLNDGENTRTLLFSGDLGNIDRPLIRNPQDPPFADYVVIESTYGDRVHGERPDYTQQLTDILQDTFDRGGSLIVPSFAVGRTQELLYLIRIIKEEGLVRGHDFSVYVDSPLAVEATRIYRDGLYDYYDEETLALLDKGIDPISFEGLKLSVSSDDSKAINIDKSKKVIISASGMCEAGRIRHHLKHNLWNENNTVLFVGYQTEGTIGRKLVDGAGSVSLFGEDITVRARIATLSGISGHADRDMMLSWLSSMSEKPRKIFVNHGQDSVCESFADTISAQIGTAAVAPFSGDEYELIGGECTARGKIVRKSKESDGRRRANLAYERLLAAEKRLLTLIQMNKGLSNKDLAKFTSQIEALCEKYSK